MLSNLARIVKTKDTQVLELWTAGFAIFWGAFLGAPFDIFTTNASFIIIQTVPEFVWGAVAFILGLTQLFGLEHGNHQLRRIGAKGLMILWTFVGVTFIATNWRFMATVIYPSIAGASFWVHWRLGPSASPYN